MKLGAVETFGGAIRAIEKFVLELDPSVRADAFRFLIAREFEETSNGSPAQVQTAAPQVRREISASEFLRTVGVATMMDKAVALGYWLELHKGNSSFSSGKLKEAFEEAREAPPANPSDIVAKLEAAGKLLRADKVGLTQYYRLTSTAIADIETSLQAR